MPVCGRCTTQMLWDAQVCIGCGASLAAPIAPAAEKVDLGPAPHAPDNPWRQQQIEPPPLPVEAPAALDEPTTAAELLAPPAAEPVAYTPPALGTSIPLPFADPLPPLPVAEPYVAPAPVAVSDDLPAIPLVPADGVGTVRGVGQPAEETLAVPAAYASFAPEPMRPVPSYAPESGTAEVVELEFPAVLTVAPPVTHAPGWPQEQSASL
jgi:hypothetical protein